MNYENWCSRANPGYIIIVVDQNEYMGEVSSGGQTLAQRASNIVSNFLTELGICETSGTTIPRKARIAIVGYGGITNSVTIIHNRYMDDLLCDDGLPIDTIWETISDHAGGWINIECCKKRFVEPTASGSVKVLDAFRKVKSMIIAETAFSKKVNKEFDPVPIILHISTNICPIITNECFQIVDSIKRTKLQDGFPLLMNCILTKDESYELVYPHFIQKDDAIINSFFSLSSQIPNTFIQGLRSLGYYNISSISRALAVNPDELHALDFGLMQFGGSEPHIYRFNN